MCADQARRGRGAAGRAGPCAARAAARSPAPAASRALHGPAASTTASAATRSPSRSTTAGGDDRGRPRTPRARRRRAAAASRDQRPRDRARIALQVVREEARAADLAGQLRLERAHLRRRRAAAPPGSPTRATPRGLGGPRVGRPGARSARPCGGSAPPRRAAPRARRTAPSPARASSSSGPASLSEQSTLPSPSPVVPPDTAPRSSSATATPRTASSRATAAPTMPAPTTTTSVTGRSRPGTGPRRRAGTGPCPVIHARPVISGTIAGRPATVVSSTTRPVKRVPITDSLTNASPTASSPRACSCASRADVPVPHGERSSQPGWIDVAARASAPSRPGAWKHDVVAARDPRVARDGPGGRRRRSRR